VKQSTVCCGLVLCAGLVAGAVPAGAAPVQKATYRQLVYDVLLKGKKVGVVKQKEQITKDKVIVEGTSDSTVKVWFFKVKTTVRYRVVYNARRQLVRFDLDQTQRGKRLQVAVRRTAKGLSMKRNENGKRKKLFFPFSSFASHSRQYRLKLRPIGKKVSRLVLNFTKGKVAKQTLHFQKKDSGSLMGKAISLWEVTAKGPRGTATLWMTKGGALFESVAHVRMLGKLGIKLRSVTGQALQ
jgi:hypothetical protein